MQKSLLIFLVIILGSIFTFGKDLTMFIRPNLMAMLFFSFVNIQINRTLLKSKHIGILLANILLPIFLYLIFKNINETLALAAFTISIIPTAIAAPILAQVMKRNVGTVTFSILLTTPLVAIMIPLMFIYVLDSSEAISVYDAIYPVLSLIAIPLIGSQLVRLAPTKLLDGLVKLSVLTFPLFLFNLFIACGSASEFLRSSNQSWDTLASLLALVSFVAVLQFQIGHFIGRKEENIEFSLSLGRKNTMLGIWLALTYFEPIVVLGPVFYILVQNVYNSIQIWYNERSD